MIFPSIYFSISAIESFLMLVYIVSIGSEPSESILFKLSLPRLLLATMVFLLTCAFIFLAYSSLKNRKNEFSFSNKFLANENSLWISLLINFMLLILLFFLFTQNINHFGRFMLIYHRLKSVFVFFIIQIIQMAFIILIWYALNFTTGEANSSIVHKEKVLIFLFCMFSIFVIVKLIFVTPYAYGPVGDMDEMDYFYMAESTYNGNISAIFTYHYPPLYPVFISTAMAFKWDAYSGIKLISAITSSSLIFPTYLISNKFLDSKKSMAVAFFSCLIPFHLVFSGRIASESLYFPLLFWAMYIALVEPSTKRFRLCWDLLNGLIISCLYLTRYISLAVIPFFLIAWWFKPKNGKDIIFKIDKEKLIHLMVLLFGMAIAYFPWLFFCIKNQLPAYQILGFIITSKTTPEQLTLQKLLIYCVLIFCYIILTSAPVLNLVIGSLRHLKLKNRSSLFVQWVVLVFLVILGFYIATVRHSWRALYNAELPVKIMGRYLIYFSPMLFTIAVSFLTKKITRRNHSVIKFILYQQLLPFTLVLFSYLILFKDFLIRTNANKFNLHGSVDAHLIEILGHYFLMIIFLVYAVVNFFLWVSNQKQAFNAIFVGLIIYYFWGLPKYSRDLLEYRTYPWLAQQVYLMLPPNDRQNDTMQSVNIGFTYPLQDKQRNEIYNSLRVRGVRAKIFDGEEIENFKAAESEFGFIIDNTCEDNPVINENSIVSLFDGQQFKIIPLQ